MSLTIAASLTSRKKAEVLFLPFWKGKSKAEPAFPHKGHAALFAAALKSGDFKGAKEEILCTYPEKGKEERVVLIGLGAEKKLTVEGLRRAYGKAVKSLHTKKVKSANVCLPVTEVLGPEELIRGVSDGVFLASYLFDALKSEKSSGVLRKISFVGAFSPELAAVKENRKIIDAVNFTRDLVIRNADEITPTYLGKLAKEMAKEFAPIKTTVITRNQFEQENLHLLQAVSRGATEEPALITMEYRGAQGDNEVTALVGKGITYDTGGLSLKTSPGMLTMRDDMSGAAAVFGTIYAIATLKLPINVVAVVAATENVIGPKSYKIGDVYQSRGGVTVEVTNTDAEGRLVLADALAYVQDVFAPKQIIDIATLTGAAVIVLGEEAGAIMSNNDRLAKNLIKAGEVTYERLWPLPLYEEYRELMKSEFADIKNSGKRLASASCAGIFLERFIKKTAWAHLDVAGVTFPDSRKPYHAARSTGFGVRLLVEFLKASLG
ncbi:MAG: Cytosol aminopeptidase [Chlamydiae bacterium]|nr:Cytosol aminopeptidase [Chlamydiota bacterium]